ncbi:MAG: arsenate reductase ArsC [candidate division WOR-3 bacterium]
MNKQKVLFICTHNSARSQMAEGLLNHLYGDKYEAYSAGTQPTQVNLYAIKVMQELGIDISRHRSKSLQEFLNQDFDYVITVCDSANETCPFFPNGKKRIHQSFQDPTSFIGISSEEEILNVFRQVRDKIKQWIQETFE